MTMLNRRTVIAAGSLAAATAACPVVAEAAHGETTMTRMIRTADAADRDVAAAQNGLDDIQARHPDLAMSACAYVPTFDRGATACYWPGDVDQVYGDAIASLEGAFPDGEASAAIAEIRKLNAISKLALDMAKKRLDAERDAAGLTAAWSRLDSAMANHREALRAIAAHQPATVAEYRERDAFLRRLAKEARQDGSHVDGKKFLATLGVTV